MIDPFVETLHSWQTYYFMIGGAAAGLMGLMLVALSLGVNRLSADNTAYFSAFATPSVIYLTSVILVACVMLVPAFIPSILGLILLAGGAVGLGRATYHSRLLINAARKHQDFNLWDWLSQIIFPVTGYLLLVLAGLGFEISTISPLAFAGIWLATVMLAGCTIANTWAMVVWIVEQYRT